MKILVIGSTSTIGNAIASVCSEIAVVHKAGRRDADVYVDLADIHALPVLDAHYDVIIHVAADFGGTKDEDLVRAEIVNAGGALVACNLARQSGARHFILISSVFAAFKEDHPFYNIYSISKRHAEEVAQYYCNRHEIVFTALRPSQVYDEAGRCRKHQPLFFHMVDKAAKGEDITIYGSHDARRNYLFLDDFTEIVKQVIRVRPAGTYTCAGSSHIKLSKLAEAAFSAFKRGGRVQFDPTKPDMNDVIIPEDTRLYGIIGVNPLTDVREGLIRIAAFRNKNGG